MKLFQLLAFTILTTTAFAQKPTSITPVFSYAEPAISPDGKEIAFVSGGDIWTVNASGGDARLLVSHPATESRPLYSPNGKQLAFQSTRTGGSDIYILDIQSGDLKRLTFGDAAAEINAWTADSKHLYFSAADKDISGMKDIFRIPVAGGMPVAISNSQYISEYGAAPSPDGKTLLMNARGNGTSQWWRNGHSHLDESEIYLYNTANQQYKKIADRGAKQLWPMWAADGKTIYYVSDRTGTQNLWSQQLEGAAKQLTQFKKGRVLYPSITTDGRTIVFERDFAIWSFNTANGQATELKINRVGVPASPQTEHQRLTSGFSGLALSPDAKKVAFIAFGDVFVASAKDGGDAARITTTIGREAVPLWTNNSNRLIYTSYRTGVGKLYEYNFITGKEAPLTDSKLEEEAPALSPDGKMLAYIRNDKELHVVDLATKQDKLLTKGFLANTIFGASDLLSWSPDSKWIAYPNSGTKGFENASVVPAAGGEGKAVSFLANSNTGRFVWDKEGKSLFFLTNQRTENVNVARVDLVPQQPRFRENQFRELFIDEVPATTPATKPATTPAPDTLSKKTDKPGKTATINIVWDGIRQRMSFVPLGVSVSNILMSKDGKTLILTAAVAGQSNIYTWSIDELAKDAPVLKQITTTPGSKNNLELSGDGKEIYYLEGGRIQAVNLDTRVARQVAVTAELDVDFNTMKMETFNEAWLGQYKGFYDANFHGADWNAMQKQYAPYAAGASTPDELRRVISLMIGELNASHLGIAGPPATGGPVTGNLGLRFDQSELDSKHHLKITNIIGLGPAALSGKIAVGDYLQAIDGSPVTATTNIDELLQHTINKRVLLTIGTTPAGGTTRSVEVRPISLGAEKQLLYKEWVAAQRAYVNTVSKGRLGYVHMADMSQGSLDQLYVDMDAENHSKEGVVIDIRNNNGGFVNAYALDVFARRPYMTMQTRDFPAAPARVALGQRSLEAPTILVINQHSLSDAEDFTQGYRTLGLGKIVGEPTSGWIIFTGSLTLIDGSTMRMPGTKITDHEGKNMELNPRPVDVFVSKSLGHAGKDEQLDVAVKELLKEVDRK